MIGIYKPLEYKIVNAEPITLSHCSIDISTILEALINTNKTIYKIILSTENKDLSLFDAVDFRNLSGVIGELFANELQALSHNLYRNRHFHGYPDIIQVSTIEMRNYCRNAPLEEFLHYKYGGIEIKNTFGTKKQNSILFKGDTRISDINKKLDWKAHHRQTNFLLGIVSDFIDGVPTIVAACFSDELTENDWNEKQEPKGDSAMTSFTTISRSGYIKMKQGLKVCLNKKAYLDFFDAR